MGSTKNDDVRELPTENLKLLVTLSGGAIVLIATFMQQPPNTQLAKQFLVRALFLFLLCFFVSFGGLFFAGFRKGPLGEERGMRQLIPILARFGEIAGFFFFLLGILDMYDFAEAIIESWPG